MLGWFYARGLGVAPGHVRSRDVVSQGGGVGLSGPGIIEATPGAAGERRMP